MNEILVYGKIIIDDIRLKNGQRVRSVLGGGGPQAAFGARLWGSRVGFLSRSGRDLSHEHIDTLADLDINLDGCLRFEQFQTPRAEMVYDENEYPIGGGLVSDRDEFQTLLSQSIPLPTTYQETSAIHLITEFPDEPMVRTALDLKARGAVMSLEPLMWQRSGKYQDRMLTLFKEADIVTPDWPAATRVAGSDDPSEVLKYWSGLGPHLVAIRHGAQGSYVWDRDHGIAYHIPIVNVEAVDPTGAGNAYGGGLCAGWVMTKDARLAGCYGTISAAFLVRRYGLPRMSPELTREAIQRLDELVEHSVILNDPY
jgi:sugar/nucleoside kinase (ribokinase family)